MRVVRVSDRRVVWAARVEMWVWVWEVVVERVAAEVGLGRVVFQVVDWREGLGCEEVERRVCKVGILGGGGGWHVGCCF